MYDVIIIGAGLSGCIAAYKISKAGYKVLLIESKKEVGKPVQCGEATTEFCLKNLKIKPDHNCIKNQVKGCRIILPNSTFFYSSASWINLDRKNFDKYILKKALSEGSKIITKNTMNNLKFNNNKWNVFTNKDKYHSKILIGADGPLSRTARILGLFKNRNYIKGIQYKFKAKDIRYEVNDWLNMYMDASLNGGYKWVFPRGDEYNIGLGGPDVNISILQNFCKFLNIDFNKNIGFSGGLLPFNFEFKKRTSKQCCIIGDAAGMTNPSTGAGIHAGLASGVISSKSVIKSLETGDYENIKGYDEEINKSLFLHPMHKKTASYMVKWSDEDWAKFGNAMNGLDVSNLTLFKSFLIGLKNPSLFLRSGELLTVRKTMKINSKFS